MTEGKSDSIREGVAGAASQNWARCVTYQARELKQPRSVEELCEIVRGSEKVKVIGSKHAFNDCADTVGVHVSLESMSRIVEIDEDAMTVTIEGALTYAQLTPELRKRGLALHNLASLPHISVAGACATATHGSGDMNGNLATAVVALELVNGEGVLIKLSRETDGEKFRAAVVNLGAIGVVTKITLRVEPDFEVRQNIFEELPYSRLYESFDAITSSAYSVSLFTTWQGETISQVWLKQRTTTGQNFSAVKDFFGASAAPVKRHPITAISPESCTIQLGSAGPSDQRLCHFLAEYTPSVGEELQTEMFVPRNHAVAALKAIRELRNEISPYLLITEIRTVAADELWMSPCYKEPCIGIHFTWKKEIEGVRSLIPKIQERLTPFDVRPHWAKIFDMRSSYLEGVFPRLREFRQLAMEFDPKGKFRNAYLDRVIWGYSGS